MVPKGVEITFDGTMLLVKGPKGELRRLIHPKVQLNIDGPQILVTNADNSKESRSLYGLFRSLIANMVLYRRNPRLSPNGQKHALNPDKLVFGGHDHPQLSRAPLHHGPFLLGVRQSLCLEGNRIAGR